jgi:hypothetical protein
MLVLKVRRGEVVTIGEARVRVIRVNDEYDWAEIGIMAPPEMAIDRTESPSKDGSDPKARAQALCFACKPLREDGPDFDGPHFVTKSPKGQIHPMTERLDAAAPQDFGPALEGSDFAQLGGVLPNVQRSWTNVTLANNGSFAPNAQGWQVSNPPWTSVELDMTLQTADLNDATLQIDVNLEWTTDATGATGWQTLTGGTWNGGPHGRDHTAKQPSYSLTPFNGTWPPGLAAMRLHADPNRQVQHVDAVVSASS